MKIVLISIILEMWLSLLRQKINYEYQKQLSKSIFKKSCSKIYKIWQKNIHRESVVG